MNRNIYKLIIIIIIMDVRCLKCGYKWITKSNMIKISCPSCGDKVKIRERHKKLILAKIKE